MRAPILEPKKAIGSLASRFGHEFVFIPVPGGKCRSLPFIPTVHYGKEEDLVSVTDVTVGGHGKKIGGE